MSWLSSAVKKIGDKVKKVAGPVAGIVDPGVSLAGGYGKKAKKVAAGNIAAGAAGGAVIVAAPALGPKLTTAAVTAAADMALAQGAPEVGEPLPPVSEVAPASVLPASSSTLAAQATSGPAKEEGGIGGQLVGVVVVGVLAALAMKGKP